MACVLPPTSTIARSCKNTGRTSWRARNDEDGHYAYAMATCSALRLFRVRSYPL